MANLQSSSVTGSLNVSSTINAKDMVLGSTFSYSYTTDSTWQSAMQTITQLMFYRLV